MDQVRSKEERRWIPEIPLKEGEIRLISLLHSQDANTIECKRTVVSLTDSPPYHALSYVWGDVQERLTVVCDGVEIQVTRNLYEFLLHIQESQKRQTRYITRHAGRGRGESTSSQELIHTECCHDYWWIDVLSIRQDDIVERNAQVALMGQIFRNATCVVVWLKKEAIRVQEAVEYIQHGRKEDPRQTPAPDLLVHTSWFNRMWTLQEYVLARETTFCYGLDRLGRENMVRYLNMLADDGQSDFSWQGVSVVTELHNIKKTRALSEILAYASRRIALDDRDRLFAILSLLPDRELYQLNADYGLSISDTCKLVTRAIITRERNLKLFDSGGLQNLLNSDIPSWAHDLRPGLCIQPDSLNEQYFTRPVIGSASNDDELQFRGVVVGVCESFNRTQAPYHVEVTLNGTFMPASNVAGGLVVSQNQNSEQQVYRRLLLQLQKSDMSETHYRATLPIFSVEIGIGKQEPGDLICMLLGGKRLYCLREVGDDMIGSGEMVDAEVMKENSQETSDDKEGKDGLVKREEFSKSREKSDEQDREEKEEAAPSNQENSGLLSPLKKYQFIGILQRMKSPELESAISQTLTSCFKNPGFKWMDFVLV